MGLAPPQARSPWLTRRVVVAILLELAPLAAGALALVALNLEGSVAGNLAVVLGLAFCVSGLGWFALRQYAVGGAILIVRGIATIVSAVWFFRALGAALCESNCASYSEPNATLVWSLLAIVFLGPIVSTAALALAARMYARGPLNGSRIRLPSWLRNHDWD